MTRGAIVSRPFTRSRHPVHVCIRESEGALFRLSAIIVPYRNREREALSMCAIKSQHNNRLTHNDVELFIALLLLACTPLDPHVRCWRAVNGPVRNFSQVRRANLIDALISYSPRGTRGSNLNKQKVSPKKFQIRLIPIILCWNKTVLNKYKYKSNLITNYKYKKGLF